MEATTPMDEVLAELARVRAELAHTQARLDRVETGQSDAPPAPTDRRGFFKLAAGTAAGAMAATVIAAEPAAADTGLPVLLGQTTSPTSVFHATVIESPSGSTLMQTALRVDNYTGTRSTPTSTFRIAVYGTTSDGDDTDGLRVGLMGETHPFSDTDRRGVGVYGAATADEVVLNEIVGVFGTAGEGGTGVKGQVGTANGIGVSGLATNADAIGIVGENTSAGGLAILARSLHTALRVEGGLHHEPAATAGPPASGEHSRGQQHRDSAGDLYICTADGTPGTWRKVVAQHPTYAGQGGSINLLAAPIRVVDTRGLGAPLTNGNQRLAAGSTVQFQITGTSVGSVSVPTGAKGILGNITAVQPTGGGFMTLFAASASLPTASNLNYAAGSTATANSIICALSPGGAIKVNNAQSSAHFILDVAGFLF